MLHSSEETSSHCHKAGYFEAPWVITLSEAGDEGFGLGGGQSRLWPVDGSLLEPP